MKVLALAFAVLMAGCTTTAPNTQPFQQFLDATSQLASSADQAISLEYEQSLAAYENRFKTGEDSDIAALLLGFDEQSIFSAQYQDAPVFVAISDQRRELAKLNQLVTEYAALLVRIVGASGAYDVSEQANAINTETRRLIANARESQGANTSTQRNDLSDIDASALLSTAFSAAAKVYIESKRREDLLALLNEGQPAIEAYAALGQALARSAVASLKTDYSNQFSAIVRKNKTNVKGVLALNDRLLREMKFLRVLDDTFASLPREHARLIVSVKSDGEISFKSLQEQAKTLKSLYGELARANATDSKRQ